MENRAPSSVARNPVFQQPQSALPEWLVEARPLSDIREITEPSLIDPTKKNSIWSKELAYPRPLQAREVVDSQSPSEQRLSALRRRHNGSPAQSPESIGDKSSIYSIPLANVPPRSSSKPRHTRSFSVGRESAVPLKLVSNGRYHVVANNGQSRSPVKEIASRLDVRSSEHNQRIPSKTIIKLENAAINDVLDHPLHQHPRLKVDLQVAAPLFVGGSSVEGAVRIIVDEAERVRHKKTLTLERVIVDLLGIEEVSGVKRNIFLALGNELIDTSHPPPGEMIDKQQFSATFEKSWILVPSVTVLPFLLTLPLEVGPPPFYSRHARIRYVLSATLTVKDAGRQLIVRTSQETSILSVYDPEKALTSLPSPLTASDEYVLARGNGQERVIATAGLHRQVWVSGTNIFADVHIVNNSRKSIKKMELQLERIVLCYMHAAAATLEMSASQARLFDQLERSVVCKTVIKAGNAGWNGVLPFSSNLRTCNLELPRGHATIKCNKYFEVRYYLNVVVSTSHHKLVTVQLPIILIHMNSLDVPTNSVAQVAAAIEEKRGRGSAMQVGSHGSPRIVKKSSVVIQGRAFSAPRTQSLERQKAHRQDLARLEHELESSPRRSHFRRRPLRKISTGFSFKTPPSNRKGRIIQRDEAEELRRQLGHMRSFGSNATNQSMPPNRHRPRAMSAFSQYASSERHNRPEVAESFTGRGKPSSQRSFVLRKPKWKSHENWRPAWWETKGVGKER